MNKNQLILILLLLPLLSLAQLDKYKTVQSESEGYKYETVKNDPLNARIYTLSNGLKVYMSVYKDAPRIQTYIAVKAGSKTDPAHATGLAHYLEHMMFKGTDDIGSLNWEAEKKQLDSIEALYEVYRNTVSDLKRKRLYAAIDSLSQVAARYAVANEYDKMLSNIGATGTNAYTFVEQTVYVNNIPSNSLEKWAQIEAERFSMVAPRLFHTELEAVYEEKNRGLDSDRKKLWEAMLAGLFPDHPYGTQTTIGTVDHLKNPSITEIKKYFDKYYVPNNMAIAMSGDFDPDQAIKAIDKHFSKLRPMDSEPFKAPDPNPITQIKEDTVWGPDAESVTIAYRFRGKQNLGIKAGYDSSALVLSNPDHYLLKLVSMILNNGQAGLIDLNLNQKQKVLSASAYDLPLNDYSLMVLSGKPKQGQSLEKTRDLLLDQVDSLKEGKFPDWLLEAVVNDYRINKMRGYESNKARADAFVDAFTTGTPWNIYAMEQEILASFKKKDVVEFVNKFFKNNYLVVYKKSGADKSISKVEKPAITPVKVNRDTSSMFYSGVMAKPMGSIDPVFVDYSKDLLQSKNKNKLPILYKQNEENDLYNLHYVWDIGKKHDPRYAIAAGYMSYLGTNKLSPEELNKEFYKLGANFSFSAGEEQIIFSLSGLNENFDQAYKLFERVITQAQPDESALKEYVSRILKSREDSKKNKDVILRSALASYVKYGPENPFTNNLSEEELIDIKGEELVKLVQDLLNYEHRLLYYGPKPLDKLAASTAQVHKTKSPLKKPVEVTDYTFKNTDTNKVYFVDYDMVQAEIVFLSKSEKYNKEITPKATVFNEYFGGSMGSLVFQEMRESRALAYSVRSFYSEASENDEPNYLYSYIGTQSDKIHEAISGMDDLINNMPKSEELFKTAKSSVLENIRTQRITKGAVLWDYERAKRLGHTSDIRKEIFTDAQEIDYNDVKAFQEKYFKNKPKALLIVGSKNRIDLKSLEKYGEVKELTLEEIFGY